MKPMRFSKTIICISSMLIFAGCTGHEVDGKHNNVNTKSTVTSDDSARAVSSAPPKDSLLADSTTNAPKMAGQ